MAIEKQVLKSKPVCKVTFRLGKDQAKGADTVRLVGDFNNWDTSTGPMTRLKSGEFKETLYLDLGHAFAFRYLLDDETWISDGEADRLEATPYPDVRNSVVVT